MKLHTETFLRAEFNNGLNTFFVDKPHQNFFLFQNLLGCILSYSSAHSFWPFPWLDWKTLFGKLHSDGFLCAKLENDLSTFFVDNPDQKNFLFQNLLGCIHSYSSPHSFWTCPWLDWKTLFVELHTETFMSAKFDNNKSTFFIDYPDQRIFLFQNLLGCTLSYASPQSFWTRPWLGWITLFLKLHSDPLGVFLTKEWVIFS